MTLRGAMSTMRALISVLALVLLLVLYDFKQTIHAFTVVPIVDLAGAVAAFGVTTLLFINKWGMTLAREVGFLAMARSYLASCFYSLLPTGQVGAELGKVMTLAGRGTPSLVAASVVFDKLIGLLALGVLGIVAWFFAAGAAVWMLVLVLVVVACCVGVLVCTPFATALLTFAAAKIPTFLPRFRARIASLAAPVERWATDPMLLAKVLLLGFGGQLCMVAQYVFVAHGLGLTVAVPVLAVFVVVANLATLIPISLGGVGVREASLVGMLAADGVPGESAIALSLLVFAIFLIGAAAGAVIEFHELALAWRRFINRRSRVPEARDGREDPR